MQFSKAFVRFNWCALILIYLIITAGSFVRISGSGMGCPDWPKCFGTWIPPTSAEELPANYKEIFLAKRTKKVEKFNRLLQAIGMENTATKLSSDPDIYKEESFNATKTWVEYINRLLGFLGGNALLFGFGWFLLYYRKSTLIWLSALNVILIGIEAWFGSIVVATNLLPWTITIHLLLALIILLIQLYIIYRLKPREVQKIPLPKMDFYIWWFIFGISFYQMFLGTQVREYIDVLSKSGLGRETWSDNFGMAFFIHRSFSWLVLALLVFIAWRNEKNQKIFIIRYAIIVLGFELFAGVMLAYFDMPGLVQTAHLVFATVLLGILGMGIFRFRKIQ